MSSLLSLRSRSRPRAGGGAELLAADAVGAAHARAAPVDELHRELGDLADQVHAGQADVECPQVARLVIADARDHRIGRVRQQPPRIEAGEVLADVHGVLGDQLGVEVVGQPDVLLAEHERGGGLGADDRVAVADGVAQDRRFGDGDVPGVIDVADDERGHAGAPLPGRHEDIDLGPVEHAHDRLGQFMIIIICVNVNKIQYTWTRLMRTGLRQPHPLRPAGERRALTRGSTRCRETPSARSISQRAPRLDIRKLERMGNRLARRAHISSLEKIQSPGGSPWFSTNAALASIIRLDTSTSEGHSDLQSLQ